MTRPAPKHDIPSDFTLQISALKLGDPYTFESGSFGTVYQRTINTSEGTKEVAVKVFKIDPGRAVEKYEKAMRRELEVWLRLSKHPTIVPLLGIAHVGFPLPVLVSQWMPSGTLYMYLEKQGTTTALAKAKLVRGVADGLGYLHSENVVHGDLHPGNVLLDALGHPRLTDFGLATVAGDAELQLSKTSASRSFNPRWHAPEIIGIDTEAELVRPNFKSDVYSFSSVMFFIVSGDIPWKEKKQPRIIIELSQRATPARLDNILDDHWNLIQKCWSWNPNDRPQATEVVGCLATEITPIFGRAKMPESTIRTIPPEMTESTILPPKMAARAKHDTTSTSSDTAGLQNYSPSRHKTIVLFGETGAGKSSLINLMAEKEVARTSDDMQCCTMQWQEYTIDFGGGSYTVFDTIGLEEPQLGIKEYLESVENIHRLIKELDRRGGIDLLLFCVRAGPITATTQSNYRLFYEFLCEKKVPMVLAITNLEGEQRMEDWWARNHRTFEKYQIQVAGHACIAAANRLDGRHKDIDEESRITIRNLVSTKFTAAEQKRAWIRGSRLFILSMRMLKELHVGSLSLVSRSLGYFSRRRKTVG